MYKDKDDSLKPNGDGTRMEKSKKAGNQKMQPITVMFIPSTKGATLARLMMDTEM